jgi:hypothetical protein
LYEPKTASVKSRITRAGAPCPALVIRRRKETPYNIIISSWSRDCLTLA